MVRKEFSHSPENSKLFALTGYQVCVICDASEKKEELGTGFLFMRRDWIVTAKHVVQIDGQNRNSLFARFTNPIDNEVQVEVIAIHKENDIAILQITNIDNPCKQPLYPGYDELSVTHGLICCGYTPSNNKAITSTLAQVYSKDYRERENTEIILEFESDVFEGGASGGPIFGNGGVVLGIMINQFSREDEPNKMLVRATSIQNLTMAVKIGFDTNILEAYAIVVDTVIDLNDQKFIALQKDRGYVEIAGGGKGIIIYRTSAKDYRAFDKESPHRTNETCAVVIVDESGLFMREGCDNSIYDFEGNPSGGLAQFPLRRYNTKLEENLLHVFN